MISLLEKSFRIGINNKNIFNNVSNTFVKFKYSYSYFYKFLKYFAFFNMDILNIEFK